VDDFDVIVVISALEKGLKKMGFSFKTGSGVEAVQKVLCQ
jgi:aspartate aminotransferase-like enzyme